MENVGRKHDRLKSVVLLLTLCHKMVKFYYFIKLPNKAKIKIMKKSSNGIIQNIFLNMTPD